MERKIAWGDEYSVGVEHMDAEHQRIIKLLNKLMDHAKDAPGSDTVSEVLAEMVEYASVHFRNEEHLLEKNQYPELDRQKAAHREFRRKAAELCAMAMEKDENVTHYLSKYLYDWWIDHILNEDKKYAAFLERQHSSVS